MARFVCQVVQRADRVTILWSEGSASFEPIHLSGSERERFLQVASDLAAAGLAASPFELAKLGHTLYRSLFHLDAGGAHPVHDWFVAAEQANRIDALEIVGDAEQLPWNLVYPNPPDEHTFHAGGGGEAAFWGKRFPLALGRRVNPLRQAPFLEMPTLLVALDEDLSLTADQKAALAATPGAEFVDFQSGLASRLRRKSPDVLVVLSCFELASLRFGARPVSLADLQEWIGEAKEGSPDPIVLLLGVGDAATAWASLVRDAVGRFNGVVASATPLKATTAAEIATHFLAGFLTARKPLATVLRDVRDEVGMAALGLNAHCPPRVQAVEVAGGLPLPDETVTVFPPLPPEPYFPLESYTAESRALFFGREEETLRFARLLDEPATRGVFLLGGAASGKTSLLQAGVLPLLESESVGYRALRDRTPDDLAASEADYPVLVLRATGDLVGQFADALCSFCAQPYSYTTPAGVTVSVDLPAILREHAGAASSSAVSATPTMGGVVDAVGVESLWLALLDDTDRLARALAAITAALPFELVIAIDQGEEQVTEVETSADKARRQRALEMLAKLTQSSARCKVVLVVRFEFFGQLLGSFPGGAARQGWREFHLEAMSEAALADAVLWPTNRDDIPCSDESPFTKYQLTCETGLAQQIAAEALKLAEQHQQSALPLAQAAAALLAQKHAGRPGVLRAADLKKLGGVEAALVGLYRKRVAGLRLSAATEKALHKLIASMVNCRSDGTATRDLVGAGELKKLWTGKEPVEKVVDKAAQAGLFDLQQLWIGGRKEVHVSLSQDALAQAAKQHGEDQRKQAFGTTRVLDTLWIMVPLVFLAAAMAFAITRGYFQRRDGALDLDKLDEKTKAQLDQFYQKFYLEPLRAPLYRGFMAQAEAAAQSGNALQGRQALVSQPLNRSGEREPEMRSFDWRYLWGQVQGEKFLFEGHRSTVAAVAISPDQKTAATAGFDGTVKLWNLEKGEARATLQGTKLPVLAVAFSPDGKTLAEAGADQVVRVWDLAAIKSDYVSLTAPAKTLAVHAAAVHALAFAKDANLLASGSADKTVVLWDLAKGKEQAVLKEHAAAVNALAFSADGKTLASAGAESGVVLWDVDAAKKRSTVPTKYHTVSALAFSPDGKTLCTGGTESGAGVESGVVRFWDHAAAKESAPRVEHAMGVFGVAFHPEGKTVATVGKDPVVHLWDVAAGKELGRWQGHLGWVRAVAFDAKGTRLVTGSFDTTARAWDATRFGGPEVVQAHADWVQALALGNKDRLLVSGSRDGSVKLWDAATGKSLGALKDQGTAPVTSLALSPISAGKSMTLAVGTWSDKNEGEIKLWEIAFDEKDGSYATKLTGTLKGHTGGVASVAFSPDGKHFASGGADKQAILWDLDKKERRPVLKDTFKDEIRCVAFSSDSKLLLTACKDRFTYLWVAESGIPVPQRGLAQHMGPVDTAVWIRTSGRETFATGGQDNAVNLWAVVTKDDDEVSASMLVHSFRPHTQPVSCLATARQVTLGKEVNQALDLIVSGSWDGTVRVMDSARTDRLALVGHTGPVRAVALPADLSFVASAGHDGTIRFWRAAPR